MSSSMESADPARGVYKSEALEFLKWLREKNLATFVERPQSEIDKIGNMGARLFSVTPTAKAYAAKEPQSTDRQLVLRAGSIRVTRIVANRPYMQALSAGNEYRVVLGTYHWTQNRAVYDDADDDKRFRVLIKRNAFNNHWIVEKADYGDMTKWQTHNLHGIE